MKGISTIIATVLLVVITIGLVSTAYLFFTGLLTGMTSKTISLIHVKGHYVIIRNDGTGTINANDIKVVVNGEEVEIANPGTIEPGDSKALKFVPPNFGNEVRSAKVIVLGPSNSLPYTTDFIPHAQKTTADTVAFWHLDSVNTTNYTLDGSGNSNDGYFDSGGEDVNSKIVPGKFENALEFDGNNDYLNIPSGFLPTSAITVEIWLKPLSSSTTSWKKFINTGSATNNGIYGGQTSQTLNALWSLGISWDSKSSWCRTGGLAPNNVWSHLSVTWNGTYCHAYMDGKKITEGARSGNPDWDGKPLYLGSNYIGTENFHGIIDEVVIYNRALTQEEIIDSIYG